MAFEYILKELNLKYIKQKGWLSNLNSFIISDFYLPKPNRLAIEIDGLYHKTKEQQLKDNFKDNYLLNIRKIKTLRLSNELVFKNPLKTKSILESTLAAIKTGKYPKDSPVVYAE